MLRTRKLTLINRMLQMKPKSSRNFQLIIFNIIINITAIQYTVRKYTVAIFLWHFNEQWQKILIQGVQIKLNVIHSVFWNKLEKNIQFNSFLILHHILFFKYNFSSFFIYCIFFTLIYFIVFNFFHKRYCKHAYAFYWVSNST